MDEAFDGPFGLERILFRPCSAASQLEVDARSSFTYPGYLYIYVRARTEDGKVATAFICEDSPHIAEAKQFLLDFTRLRCGA